MSRPLAQSLSILALALFVQVGGSRAQDLDDEAQAVPDAELSEMRGGFVTAGGVSFDFGATLSTLVDGQLALQTSISYQPGQLTSVTTAGAGVTALTGAALDQFAGQGVAPSVQALPVYSAANGGVTLIQGQTGSGLVNVALNTAANQTVVQNTNLTVTIPNGASFQAGALTQTVFNGLTQQIAQGALSTRH